MFEIEYSLTLEDEINSLDTRREYISCLPLLYWQNDYILSICCLLINIPSLYKCLTTNIPFYTGFEGISISGAIVNLLLAMSFVPQVNVRLPIYNLIPKYDLKRSWSNHPEQTKPRKIIVTSTEFIFNKTETYMFLSEEKIKIYKWQELRRYLERDRGFFLDFTKWNQFNRNFDYLFIPRRIFTTQEQINTFRELLSQCER